MPRPSEKPIQTTGSTSKTAAKSSVRARSQPPPIGTRHTSGSPTGPPHALQRKEQLQKLETGIILSTSDIKKTETLRRPESPKKDLRKEGTMNPPRGSVDPPRGSKLPAPIQDGKGDHCDGKMKTSDKQTGKQKDKTKKDSPSRNPKKHKRTHSPTPKEKKLPKKTTKERTEKPPREKILQVPHDIDPFEEADYGNSTPSRNSRTVYTPSGSTPSQSEELSLSGSSSKVEVPRTSQKEALRASRREKIPSPPKEKHSDKRGRSTNRKPPEKSSPKHHKRSRSTSSDTDFMKRSKKLSKEIRTETAGRPKFADFTYDEYYHCARLFVDSGYTSVDSIRQMQETARQYFLTDLRKGNKTRKPLKELRLVIDIFGLFVIQKDEEKPKYEEITIPEKLKAWSPSITSLRGILLPDQDACNYFSFELAKGRCKTPPIIPFVIADFSKKPWLPAESSHTRALESWRTMNKNHKRPSKLELGFQAFITYNLRFILAGDLASAWKTFGGIAMQLTHLGTVLNLAVTENATIAMIYDNKIRTYANELSKFRSREKDIINLLKEEDQRIKRETIKECGPTNTFVQKGGPSRRDPRKRQDKGGKGNKGGGKGNGKSNGRPPRKRGWFNSDWHGDNWNQRPSNDGNTRPTNNAPAADNSQQTVVANSADSAQTEKPSKKKQRKQ